MSRAFRAQVALAATLALAAFSVRPVRADLNFNTEHDVTYTLGITDPLTFSGTQLLYEAADTVTSTAVGSTGNYTVNLLGDASTFTWSGANGLTVSNVTTNANTASATLTSDGTPGTSGYNYVSNDGQGFFTVSGGKLFFSSGALDLATDGAALVESIGLQGSWTAASYTTAPGFGVSFALNGSNGTIENLVIGDRLAVTNLFTDSGLGFVRFDATAAVPEPGAVALLVSVALSGLGLAAHRRR